MPLGNCESAYVAHIPDSASPTAPVLTPSVVSISGTTGLITSRAVTVAKNAAAHDTRTVFLYDQFTIGLLFNDEKTVLICSRKHRRGRPNGGDRLSRQCRSFDPLGTADAQWSLRNHQ
jgi:hypothetical protein